MKKFDHFRTNIGAMDSLFEASFSPLAATGKLLSKCGKCLRYMRYIPLKPQRLYCPTCEETYALPQNGTIKLYKELKCPLDQFDLVLFSLGNSEKALGKSYPLCPCCYNYPPSFEDLENAGSSLDRKKNTEDDTSSDASTSTPVVHGNMGCNSCLHPSCKHSLAQNGICQCPGTSGNEGLPCEGTLVLDLNSKPNWKLGCNQCNTLIRFKAEIHNIVPQVRKDCPECGVKIVNFEFNKLKSPLTNGDTSYSGCIVCDDFLNGISDIVAGRSMNITVLRQMKQRRAMAGRGGKRRGGRGRGRGKPRSKADVLMSFSDF
jgi:DNA topoisomerase-3